MAENPPAFPATVNGIVVDEGMSLRDYFAGQALAGLLAHHGSTDDNQGLREVVAYDAYSYADAMIEHRKKSS